MRITIEAGSGFCFGVRRAIEKAEEALEQGEELYCLGQIVHNEEETRRLWERGMKQTSHAELDTFSGKKVLLRAHGEPPETYDRLHSRGIRVIDATCPVVKKLQVRVKKAFKEKPGTQVLIYGKQGHPEVIGLEGQTGYRAIVVGDDDVDLAKVDFLKPVVLFSQTTKSLEGFRRLVKKIRERMEASGVDPDNFLRVNDTVCRQVSGRGPAMRQFAQSHDVIIFVGGANSSNGRYLFGLCKEKNQRSYLIANEKELQREWFTGAQSAGVSGATSTPRWQMERVAEAIRDLNHKGR